MRRLYHLVSGLLLTYLISQLDRKGGLILVSVLLALAIILETARLILPAFNRLFIRCFSMLLRQEEKRKPTSSAWYIAGVLISLLLFKREFALFSMVILAVGDPSASTVGKTWGRHRIKKKSIEGSIAFLVSAIIAGFIFQKAAGELPYVIIFAGAFAGTITELASTKLDDNFTIPLIASVCMQAVYYFLNSYLHF
ncbi:MAG: hypothetical protein HZA08_11105 [Nitrospirae bacterium]|nr:hypothetical protein [Nitrospirota bacterium]